MKMINWGLLFSFITMFALIFGFGWLIWAVSGGFSLFYRVLWVVGAYGAVAFVCFVSSRIGPSGPEARELYLHPKNWWHPLNIYNDDK